MSGVTEIPWTTMDTAITPSVTDASAAATRGSSPCSIENIR
jgi:hypothetical protein